MPLVAGDRLGPYEIVAPLGAGGMGEVYRARDSKLKREVAIKVLPADVANDRERLARFQREAEVLASLNHPHIAHVYGIEANALVMELVEGEDLSQRIARGTIPIDETLSIARQIAEALEGAHEAGIIHRDLKPANIKVRDDGTVKVLDFGLAKAQGSGSGDQGSGEVANSPTITTPAMTMRGVILGTAAYMSPEQAKGKAVDRRADIWAFGCVLYEMLTGKRAFKGDDVTDIITSVMRDTPDWTALPADTPISIRVLLRRCLDRDPRKRAPHIAIARMAIDDALMPTDQLIPGITIQTAVTKRRGALRAVVAAAAIVAIAGIGYAAWGLRPAPAPLRVVRFQVATTQNATLQSNFNRQLLAVSPDGTQVALAADQLYLRSIGDDEARPVPGTGVFTSLTHPTFSPDGQSVVFWAASDRSLKKVNLSTGAISTVCALGEGGYGLSWAGDEIFFADNGTGIMRVSSNGGQPELLIPAAAGEEAYGPQLLPDGETLLFTLGTPNMQSWDNANIVVQSLRTKTRTVVLEHATNPLYVKTGHLLFSRSGVLYAVRFDAKQLAVIGQPIAVIEGVRRAAPATTGAVQVAVSDGGTLAYIAGPVSMNGAPLQISLFDRAGNAEPLNIPQGTYSHPRVSPDGTRVAMTVDDGKDSQVWIYGLEKAGAARRLTFDGTNTRAEWTHDGQRVAFQSVRDGDAGIWWQRADGTDTASRLTKTPAGVSHVPQAFSPDGRRLLFDEIQGGRVTLWDWSMAERKAVKLAIPDSDAPTDATFSPDGRWFAYAIRPVSGQAIVYVEPYPPTGARYQISTPEEDGHHPMWSRNGRELFYTPGPGNRFYVKSITTSPTFGFGDAVQIPRPFVNAPPTSERTYDILPNGRILGLRADVGPDGRPMSPQVRVILNWFEELKHRVPLK
jgi:serine/threonine-protein kinase